VQRLCTAEELSALSVRAETGSPDWENRSRTPCVAGAGEVAGGDAWRDISQLRAAAGERGQEWYDAFADMLAYAEAYGWLSADGRRVRAHVDWGLAAGVDGLTCRRRRTTRSIRNWPSNKEGIEACQKQ
jgi:hypothetical protein